MNKTKLSLSICSALVITTHTSNIYAQDISLFSIPSEPIQDTQNISIPTIHHRDIPIHLFQVTSSSIPGITYTVDHSKKSISALSQWQIDMDSLPMRETTTSTIHFCRATCEKLMQDFPDIENSFPGPIQRDNIEIVLTQQQTDLLHYLIRYTPFSLVDIRNRCIPHMKCSPLSIDKKESEKSAPELSSVPPFLMRTSTFSMQNALPSRSTPSLSYDIFDQHIVKDSLCLPKVASSIEPLQEVALTDRLHIEPNLDTTPIVHWHPQPQLTIFSRAMPLQPEITLPVIHTSISQYIPTSLRNISLIQPQVNRPMTFMGPFHYMENFALLPNLHDLRTISYRDEFASTTSAMPSDTGEYYFSITLTPNQHIAFPPIPQTVFFLIDRSSHITAEQFTSFQRGIIRALSYIPNHSRFNIAFFDQRVSFLQRTDLEIGSDAIHKASAFVRSASKRLLFGPSDIYSALHAIHSEVPSIVHTTYILLTSRKSLQSGKNTQLLSNFIRDHKETCTLYIASIGDDIIDIPNVEESLYSDTHATFPRRFATLVKNISFPIANHLKISAITEDPDVHIELFPNSHIIHQDKPFIIYGKMDHLKNFQLILQGNNLNSWINITKSITFNMPCHSTKSLAKHFNKPEKPPL